MLPLKILILNVLDLYLLILFARIILSWFPAIRWYEQPWKLLRDITDPVMEPFRRIIPPFSGIDFSPIALFVVLNMLKSIVRAI